MEAKLHAFSILKTALLQASNIPWLERYPRVVSRLLLEGKSGRSQFSHYEHDSNPSKLQAK